MEGVEKISRSKKKKKEQQYLIFRWKSQHGLSKYLQMDRTDKRVYVKIHQPFCRECKMRLEFRSPLEYAASSHCQHFSHISEGLWDRKRYALKGHLKCTMLILTWLREKTVPWPCCSSEGWKDPRRYEGEGSRGGVGGNRRGRL